MFLLQSHHTWHGYIFMMYKILYINSYSLYYYHHYDHSHKYCNIVLHVDLELVYHWNNILLTCLFACVIADSEYANSAKPIFLFCKSFFSGESCVWSLWLLFISFGLFSFSLDTSGKATSLTASTCSTV